MEWLQTSAIIISILTSVTVAGWILGLKIGNLGGLIDGLTKRMDDFHDRLTSLEGARREMFIEQSPVALTPQGDKALAESGLKNYIDTRKEAFIKNCVTKQKTNPYEVQEFIFDLFDKMTFEEDFDDSLKTYAFEHGLSMQVMRRIGAIYFRDICLEHFGMNKDDIA